MTQKKIFPILLTLLAMALLTTIRGYGQDTLGAVSLDRAVTIALSNNHDYRIAKKKQLIARETMNQMWGNLFPSIDSEASLIRQGAEHGFTSLSDGQYDIKIVQLRFGLNPGIFYHSLQSSRKAYKISTEEIRRIQNEIRTSVIKSYFALLLAKEKINLTKDSIALLKRNLADVTNLYRTGSVPKYDLLQARVRLKSQEPLLLDAENQYRIALEFFNYNLGSDGKKYTVKRDELKKSKLREVSSDIEKSSQALSEIALKERPEVLQLRLKQKIHSHSRKLYQSYYLWPTLSVGGYYGYNKNLLEKFTPTIYSPGGPVYADLSRLTGKREWQQNWAVKISATYRWGSLLPWDTNHVKSRKEKIEAQKSEEELYKLRELIKISITTSLSNLFASYRIVMSHDENVLTAQEGLRIARESYRAGVIKNSELLGAQFALTKAKTGYINSISRYYISLANLKKNVGIDDEDILLGGAK